MVTRCLEADNPGHRPATLLECRQLSRLDPRQDLTLLHPTDFSLRAGERVALTGLSGSGKSVLLRALALLQPAQGGELLWRGSPIGPRQVPDYRTHVCYLAQTPAMLPGTVADNLRWPFSLGVFAKARFDLEVVTDWLKRAGKGTAFLDKTASSLSGGEAQIVALARVLQLTPQVLLLDEPTAALDPAATVQIETLIDAWFETAPTERALMWISHDPQQAQRVGNRQLRMIAGKLGEASRP